MPWNTTPPSDFERIRRYCKIPAQVEWVNILRTAMARIEREVPEAIATIQALLDQIETVQTKKTSLIDGKDLGLTYKRVDVLEWKWDGQTTTGTLETIEAQLVDELAQTLMIALPNSSGGAYLARS